MNSNFIDLKKKISPKTKDEEELFYFSYHFLHFLSQKNFSVFDLLLNSIDFGFKVEIYSKYVLMLTPIFRPIKKNILIGVGTKFLPMNDPQSDDLFIRKFLKISCLDEVYLSMVIKGIWSRQKIAKHFFALRDYSLLDAWDKLRRDEVLRLKIKKIKNENEVIINTESLESILVNDSSNPAILFFLYQARLSAKNLQIAVVPHGYIQDYRQLYDFGHLADFYVAWSNGEAENIESCLSSVSAFYFGCPIYSLSYVEGFNKSRRENCRLREYPVVVFFANPLAGADNFNESINLIVSLNKFFKDKGVKFILKLHQRDSVAEMTDIFVSNGVELSQSRAEDLMIDCNMVLGFQTTVLYQAKVLGIKSLQIDFPRSKHEAFKFDGVDSIDFSDPGSKNYLIDFLKENDEMKPFENEGFRAGDLVKELESRRLVIRDCQRCS